MLCLCILPLGSWNTFVGVRGVFPPLGPSTRTQSENISCLTALCFPPGNTFPRASVTCENSFQTWKQGGRWKFFIKIRHFKEASSKTLWKSGLHLSRRRLLEAWASERGRGTDNRALGLDSLRLEVWVYWVGLVTCSHLFSPVCSEPLWWGAWGVLLTCCPNQQNMIYDRETGQALDAISSCVFSSGRLMFDCAAGRCPL